MAILALSMLAAASMQFGSIRNNASGNMVTQANMLAKAQMEVLKNTADVATLANGVQNNIDANGQPGGIYNRSWTVSTVRGVGRLYAVNYLTGASVMDLSGETETDNTGQTVDLGKKDRSIAIGTAIPSAPVIAILADGAQIFIGVEGGIVSLPTIATQDMYTYYWTQVF